MDERVVGKLLFGNPTRLALTRWIAQRDGEPFFQSEPDRTVGTASAVREELGKLERLGMVTATTGDRAGRIYYQSTTSSLWKIIVTADEVLAGG